MKSPNSPSSKKSTSHRLQQYLQLTKPRVVSLIVFCAVIGMFLATPGMVPLRILFAGTIGIGLVAGAAAAINCLIEQKIDAKMARTRGRPLPRGTVQSLETLIVSSVLGGTGLLMLYLLVNPLTMWLTLATFVGYAIIYTVFLKPNTSQNIVIGGASGAMPPVLGWAAVTNSTPPESWLLFLIIFVWTPPHFWTLALYRAKEYAAAGVPMLPVTHGAAYTRRHVFLYTIGLTFVTLVPAMIQMTSWFYLVSTVVLDAIYLRYSWLVWRRYSDDIAKKSFRWSIIYLSLLFAALLIDHYIQVFFKLMLRGWAPCLLLVLCLIGCSPQAPKFNATDVTNADWGKDFHLTDASGKPRQLADFKGKAVVLFFGYTQCPDVCPTAMTKLSQVAKLLGDDAERLQVIFVTVDPERDTPELLAQYVPAFDKRFIGLYGNLETTAATARDFKVFYQKQPGSTPGRYTMDHSSGLYVYDPKGRLRLFVRDGEAADKIAADLKILLAGK